MEIASSQSCPPWIKKVGVALRHTILLVMAAQQRVAVPVPAQAEEDPRKH